jgi:hypothetical protein
MSAPGVYPEPPIDYVSNDRGTWAVCKLCGTGLRGFKNRADTQGNAIAHLFNNHPTWQEESQ